MIYFVQRASDQAIKIGTTIRLTDRLKSLRAANGECEVLAVMDGSYADEAVLHARFSYDHLGGEWFASGTSLSNFIQSEGCPWNGEDESPFHDIRFQMSAALQKRITKWAETDGNSIAAFIRAAVVKEINHREREAEGAKH